MNRILCIEDSEEIQILVKSALHGFEVDAVQSLRDGVKQIEMHAYDLVLLDISLPDGDGLSALLHHLKKIQEQKIPVIILTSHSDVGKKVTAFSLGAEDYITKPFDLVELRARVQARIRKQESLKDSSISLGDLKIDTGKQRVTVESKSKGSLQVDLTSLEFRILTTLAKRPEIIFSRQMLLDSVWGTNVAVTDRTVDTHIAHLRKKIVKSSVQIETVTHEGYRLVIYPNKAR